MTGNLTEMNKKPPYIKFYVHDFIAGTYMLSPAAKGIYIGLLCYQWEHGTVPRDMGEVSRICNCPREVIAQHWSEVEKKFEPCEDDPSQMQNARLRDEREKAWQTYEGQQKRAEKARLTRQKTGSNGDSNVSSNIRTNVRQKKHSNTGSGSGSGSGSEKKKKNESLSVNDCLLVPIPDELRTQDFTDAWSDWINYKQASPKPWTTPRAIKAQLTKLTKIGTHRSIDAITNSIANEYQGIYEPKDGASTPQRRLKTFTEQRMENTRRVANAPYPFKDED